MSDSHSDRAQQRPKFIIYSEDTESDIHSLNDSIYDTDEAAGWNSNPTIRSNTPTSSNHHSANHPSTVGEGLEYGDLISNVSTPHQPQNQVAVLDPPSSIQSPSSSTPQMPYRPTALARTDFTTQRAAPAEETSRAEYEDALGTPRGSRNPEPSYDDIGMSVKSSKLSTILKLSYNPFALMIVIIISLVIGYALLKAEVGADAGYWIEAIGFLYARILECMILPLSFCQVLLSVANLAKKNVLRSLWFKGTILVLLVNTMSSFVSTFVGYLFFPIFAAEENAVSREDDSHPFAFKCMANNKFMMKGDNGTLICQGDSINDTTIFPQLVDVNKRLGVEDITSKVNFNQYLFAVLDTFFPTNAVDSFASGKYLSVLMIATAAGIAITGSFRGIENRQNPMLRLIMHIYATLVIIVEWIQSIAIFASFPLVIGSLVRRPEMLQWYWQSRYYCLAMTCTYTLQLAVIAPMMFYYFTRQNPFKWLWKNMTTILHSCILQTPYLPLAVATKTAMETQEISPVVFGATYPVLVSTMSYLQAVSLPIGFQFWLSRSACGQSATFVDFMLFVGFTFVSHLGVTTLPNSRIAYALIMWRTFCNAEDSPSGIILAELNFWIKGVNSMYSTAMYLLIIRMMGSFKEVSTTGQ